MRFPVILTLALAACGETLYYAPPPLTSDLHVNARARTVMVNAVSMPEYAINQEIPIQRADGGLLTDGDRLWADLPDRALQVSLSRHLNRITDAEVAIEPWPLSGFPDAEVSVVVDEMIVQANGTLRFSGTYAIRDEVRRGGRVELFGMNIPIGAVTYPAIIAAHEAAWLRLSEQIARTL